MSRRPANAGSVVSLFPFLAVLLCTIGALVLLLVIIARQSQEQALKEAARVKAAPAVDMAAVTQEQEDLDWQVEQLSDSWEKTSQVLNDQRAHLSHLEEHAQRLRAEIKQWEDAERQLAERQTLDVAAQEKLRAEIEELKRRAAEAEAKLADVKGRVKKTGFAVVPYDGQSGTRRRPIYIECRGDSIVLQPEGIVFTENDFGGSLGPSNALAACVRASAEHYARSGQLQPGEQAYPLLLVRPNGIVSYYVARAAMTSWDSEFGYELVDADWSLDFPASDPTLKQLLVSVQQEARERQVMIARAAPSLRPSERVSFGAKESGDGSSDLASGSNGAGGGGMAGGGTGGNGQSGGGPIDAPYVAPRGHQAESTPNVLAGGSFGGHANGSGVAGIPGGPGGGNGGYSAGAGGPQLIAPGGTPGGMPSAGGDPQVVTNPYATGGQPGGSVAYPGGGKPGQSGTGTGTGGNGTGGGPSPNGSYAQGGANGGDPTAEANGNSNNPGQQSSTGSGNGGVAGATGSGGSSSGSDGMVASGASGQAGSGQSGDGGSGGAGGSSGSVGSPGGSGGSGGEAGASSPDGTPPTISMINGPQNNDVDSLSKKRGKDWSLPDAARKKTPVARPVQIYCSVDRLTVMSDRSIPDSQITLGPRTADSVDQLVKTVWDQVETWGIAGRGMYWRPTLSIHYAPDGAVRFNELRTLLLGSGLEVVGKPINVARPLDTPYERR